MSPRLLCAGLGLVFALVLVFAGFGWAVFVLILTLVGYYVGAALEGDVNLAALLDPLRRVR